MQQILCLSSTMLLFPRIIALRCSELYFITSVMLF